MSASGTAAVSTRRTADTAARGRRMGAAGLLVALAIAPLVLFAPGVSAQERVTVVTTEIEPFVMREGDRPTGFYWEIWEDVAGELEVDVDVIWAASFPEMVSLLESGEADVAVAPLAPTAAREEVIDFSSAVVRSGPQYGAHDRLRSPASLLSAVIASRVLRVVAIAFGGLVVLGHIIWLVERNNDDNEHFHPSYPRGAFDGIWWAAATVTTVGYGDKAPSSIRGRLVAMVAMFLSLFIVGAFVTEISRDISEQQASNIASLADRPVAVVAETTFADFIEAQGADIVGFDSQAEAFDAVERGDVDVVLASPFAHSALAAEHGVSPQGDVLFEEFETFGVQQGSPLRELINGALADLQSTGSVQATIDRWMD